MNNLILVVHMYQSILKQTIQFNHFEINLKIWHIREVEWVSVIYLFINKLGIYYKYFWINQQTNP